MCTSKSRLVLVFRLIGQEFLSGASLLYQSESVVRQNQSKHNITFDTKLKTASCQQIIVGSFVISRYVLHYFFSIHLFIQSTGVHLGAGVGARGVWGSFLDIADNLPGVISIFLIRFLSTGANYWCKRTNLGEL